MIQKAVRFLIAAILALIAAVVPRPAAAVVVDTANVPRLGHGGASMLGGSADAGLGAAIFGLRFGSILTAANRTPVPAGFTWIAQDNAAGPFGRGTLSSVDWFLTGNGGFTLIGPDRHWYSFSNSLGNNQWSDTGDPGALGAVLTVNWTNSDSLRWKDGTVWYFDDHTPGGTGGLLSITDPHGATIISQISRNSNGLPTQVNIDAPLGSSSRMITFSYNASSLVTQMALRYNYSTTPGGNPSPVDKVWNFAYNASNQLVTIGDPLGHNTSLTWTSYTRSDNVTLPLLASVVTPLGHTVYSNQYDSSGRLIKQTYADNGYASISYSAAIGTSGTTTVTDPLGRVTTCNYGWSSAYPFGGYTINALTDPLGRQTSYVCQTGNLEHQITDYRGRVTTLNWDTSKGNLTSVSWKTPSGV